MKLVDATTLTLFLDPGAPIPDDPETGQRPERTKDRLDLLIETLETERAKLLIPTPALSEVLVKAGDAGPAFLDVINASMVFKSADFDQRAAVEAAAINIALEKKFGTKAFSGSKVKTKFDVQIVAIAKVNGADVIYSEDSDIRKLASEIGIKTVSVADLPLPPGVQQKLFEKTLTHEQPSQETKQPPEK
jgi:predicted nuclease of predicted toxin-antitoxin system